MSLYMTQLTATSLCSVQDIQDYVSLTLGHRVDIYSVTVTTTLSCIRALEKLDHETQLTATSLCLVQDIQDYVKSHF